MKFGKVSPGYSSFIISRSLLRLAGEGGFEPPNGGSKGRCLTTWRLPKSAGRDSNKNPVVCAHSLLGSGPQLSISSDRKHGGGWRARAVRRSRRPPRPAPAHRA